MKYLVTLLRGVFALLAVALTVMVGPALADTPATQWKWGCEWKQGANGNYLTKVDGGCKHWIALGYDRHRDLMGKDIPAEDEGNEPDEPSSPAAPANV